MWAIKVTEKLALTASVLALSCATDHRVSPWGEERGPPLFAYVESPDLEGRLRSIDAEASVLGLALDVELRGALPRGGGPVVLRGYVGTDGVGRTTTAVRVATPRGVVMARGPLDSARADRTQATELVPSLLPGARGAQAVAGADRLGAFRSGTDLNGDGTPDVVLRNEAGALELWSIQALGSTRYDVVLAAAPTFALDVNQDGYLDPAGQLDAPEGDPIAPELVDVATFDGDRYTDRSADARAFHAAEAAARATRAATPDRPAPPPRDEVRLRRALERAWHALLAGQPRGEVLAELDRERVPEALRGSFARHRARVARAGGGEAESAGVTAWSTASGTPDRTSR